MHFRTPTFSVLTKGYIIMASDRCTRLSVVPVVQKSITIFSVLRTVRMLRAHKSWTTERVHEQQMQSLAALRHFVYQHSPFYRTLHKGLEDAPLDVLPIVTKAAMMEQFNTFVTDRRISLAALRAHLAAGSIGRFQDKYEVVTTSGSTGNPGIFLFDPAEWVTMLASFARAREWAGVKTSIFARSKMAVVSSTDARNVSARVGKVADTPFTPTLRIDAMEPLEQITAALNAWSPTVLVAYASMAYQLAHEQAAQRLSIHPSYVFTSSEVLTPQMRRDIEAVWGAVVFNEYAATETATIAAEDVHHHGMHMCEDLLIVENVDVQNRPVPPGEFGDKLLVTSLFARTQPLIRYEISDQVRFALTQPDCTLPFQVIDGVQGRREDTLDMPGVESAVVHIHPNVFHTVMDVVPNNGWQVIQEQSGVRILIVPTGGTDIDQMQRRVVQALEVRAVRVPPITVDVVAAIPKAPSGKAPLIKKYGASDQVGKGNTSSY
jgi:phenylacetate-CoA ligase